MYNSEIKERFLAEHSGLESTKRNFRYILSKAQKTEEVLNKDIYSFTPYECDQLILSFPRRSKGVIYVIVSCFKQYIDFCKSPDVRLVATEDFNYFETIKGDESITKYLDNTAMSNKYITMDDLLEIEGLCANEQDAVILELQWIGLTRSEAIYLKVEDVHEDKIILEDRVISIEQRTYQVVRDAIEQTVYLKGNGETDAKVPELEINPTDYVLRAAGKTKSGQLTVQSYLARFNKIKSWTDNPYITPTNVRVSAQIHAAKEIKEINGEVTKDDYITIGNRFNINALPHMIKAKLESYI